jgi:enoyl-CoA hydratase/carnithine racemase
MEMPHLNVSIGDDVATLALSNPPENRITDQMVDELSDAVRAVESSGARAVLLRADGPDFSFGGDIMPWENADVHVLRSRFERYLSVFNLFEALPIPVVAAVQGRCLGGGLELAVRADVVFAGEGARFGHPEQTLGIVTLLGGIYRVAEKAGRARAAEWALTSEFVSAKTMADAGVVNRVVPDAELADAALAFVRDVATGPTRAYAVHKTLLNSWATGGVSAADAAVLPLAMSLFETEDVKGALPSAISALKEGRPRPRFGFQDR